MKYLTSPEHKISTHQIKQSKKRDYWQEVICAQYVNLDCNFSDVPHEGEIAWIEFDGIHLSEACSVAQQMVRSAKHISQQNDDHLVVNLNLSGKAQFLQNARSQTLSYGDCVFNDTGRPSVWSLDKFHHLLIQIPKEKILATGSSALDDRLGGTVLSGRSSRGKLLTDFLKLSLTKLQSPSLEPNERTIIFEQITHLVSASVETKSHSKPRVSNEIVRMVARERIGAFITHNLADTSLNPASIAKANNISQRYLHKLYEDQHHTVSSDIKLRRLRKAAEQLEKRELSNSIEVLAHSVGFKNLSHFSRSFQQHYGLSPVQFRKHRIKI